jgi:hypothetical protein
MTDEERRRMAEYEAWISQPVSVLFPKPRGFSRIITCKGCGIEFRWTPASGVIRMYHNSDCKTKNGTSQHRRRR